MDQPQTQLSTIMPDSATYTFRKEDTILRMLGLGYVAHFLFHTETFGITWLNGDELQFGEQY
jgi:hypothetical protein